jgi:hypothetical protein
MKWGNKYFSVSFFPKPFVVPRFFQSFPQNGDKVFFDLQQEVVQEVEEFKSCQQKKNLGPKKESQFRFTS